VSPKSQPSRAGLRKAGDHDLHPSTPQGAPEESTLLRKGLHTSDSVGAPDRDKLVDLGVQVPKSLRKLVRAEAKRRGITTDELVAEALRDRAVR
jgi:hypothetical protein